MEKEDYEKLSDNMKVAMEHLAGKWTEKVSEDGKKSFSIDIRPSNVSWEEFCKKNEKFIDSIKDKDDIRNMRLIFDGGFNEGFMFAKNFFGA